MSAGILNSMGGMMRHKPARPSAVAFDVIGTLFPLDPLRPAIVALGLPPMGLEAWFAAACRDAFALAAVGQFEPFATVLESALDTVLAEQELSASAAQRREVIEGMQALDARPMAGEALEQLREAQIPAIALSNGSRSTTTALLEKADLEGLIAHIISVDQVKQFKPRAEVYRLAAKTADVTPKALALVAAHGWDCNGARAAGLATAYLAADRPYPAALQPADVEAGTLPGCVAALLAL